MSQLTPSVTHMVIKQAVHDHYKLLQELQLTPYKVTIQWLIESMLRGRPVPEEDFAFQYNFAHVPKTTLEEAETQFEDELLAQYRAEAPQVTLIANEGTC